MNCADGEWVGRIGWDGVEKGGTHLKGKALFGKAGLLECSPRVAWGILWTFCGRSHGVVYIQCTDEMGWDQWMDGFFRMEPERWENKLAEKTRSINIHTPS